MKEEIEEIEERFCEWCSYPIGEDRDEDETCCSDECYEAEDEKLRYEDAEDHKMDCKREEG